MLTTRLVIAAIFTLHITDVFSAEKPLLGDYDENVTMEHTRREASTLDATRAVAGGAGRDEDTNMEDDNDGGVLEHKKSEETHIPISAVPVCTVKIPVTTEELKYFMAICQEKRAGSMVERHVFDMFTRAVLAAANPALDNEFPVSLMFFLPDSSIRVPATLGASVDQKYNASELLALIQDPSTKITIHSGIHNEFRRLHYLRSSCRIVFTCFLCINLCIAIVGIVFAIQDMAGGSHHSNQTSNSTGW